MAFIPFANCADVFLNFDDQGEPWGMSFMVKAPGAIDSTTLEDIYNVFDSWWAGTLNDVVSVNANLNTIKVTDLTTQFSGTFEQPPSTSGAGQVSGTGLSSNVALVTTLRTAKRGRSYRGRSYLGCQVTSKLATDQTWTSAWLATVLACYTELVELLTAASFDLVVGSRQENKVVRSVGVATHVTSFVPRAKIATMRKRLS